MFVYVIVNSVTLKIYVGKTTTGNLDLYLKRKIRDAQKGTYGGRSYLFASMQKHPSSAWSIHPLFKGITNEEICEHEKLLIKTLAAQRSDIGYNICRGGEGRTGSLSTEEKIKLRAANLAYWDRLNNLTGQTFNRLYVQSQVKTKRGRRRWNCRCTCGNFTTVTTNALKSGAIKSCGCLIPEAGRNRWAKQNVTGQIFGKLIVVSEAGRNKNKQRLWKCLCVCGNHTVVKTNSLMTGNSKSCGCVKGAKGLKWVHKDGKETRIKQIEVETFLTNGWKLGQAFARRNAASLSR